MATFFITFWQLTATWSGQLLALEKLESSMAGTATVYYDASETSLQLLVQ
jgi:hypothetical protein